MSDHKKIDWTKVDMRARIAELEKALERIVALDNQIDVTPRGKRKVVYGVFARIARRVLKGDKADD